MRKDDFILWAIFGTLLFLIGLLIEGCSLINVQIAQGHDAKVNKVFDPGAVDIKRSHNE